MSNRKFMYQNKKLLAWLLTLISDCYIPLLLLLMFWWLSIFSLLFLIFLIMFCEWIAASVCIWGVSVWSHGYIHRASVRFITHCHFWGCHHCHGKYTFVLQAAYLYLYYIILLLCYDENHLWLVGNSIGILI